MKAAFTAKLWVWPGDKAQWRGVTVPKDISESIRSNIKSHRGFGAIKVAVKVGTSRWETSIFPDSSAGTYLLFIKAPVRRAEGIEDGDVVSVSFRTV